MFVHLKYRDGRAESPRGPLPAPFGRHELQLQRPEALRFRRELAGRRVRLDFLAAYWTDFLACVDVQG